MGLTALIGIISVLSGEFGDLQLKVLATSIMISGASILSMSCAAFIEKKKLTALGLFGILLTLSAAILSILGMWLGIDTVVYWKPTITFVVFAVAFAHAFLLVLPELDDKHKWVQLASSVSIGLLAALIAFAAWGEIDDEGFYRFVAIVAIIVGLETLVVPIFMKLRKGQGQRRESLILESIGGEIYKDSAGTLYAVRETNPEQGAVLEADQPLR